MAEQDTPQAPESDAAVPVVDAADPAVDAAGPAVETAVPKGAGSPLVRGRRWVVGLVAAALTLTGAGVAATALIKSPAQAAAETAPPPPDVLTAPVEKRVLTSSVILRGTVVAAQAVEVTPSGGGEGSGPVVTKLPVKSGSSVRAGALLAEVSGRPVILLHGSLPVYRDLKPGSEGDDVAQLQKALTELGHSTAPDGTGRFGTGTKKAVKALYAALGYDPLQAVDDDGAAVESAQDQVTTLRRALEDAQRTLARAGADTDSAKREDLQSQVNRTREDLEKATAELAEAQAAEGPLLPASEVVFASTFPARVDSVAVALGTKVSGPVMKLSAGPLVVQGRLQADQKALVRAGQKVRILSEITGQQAAAKVAMVAEEMATDQAGSGDQSGDGQGAPKQAGGAGSGYLLVVEPLKGLPRDLIGQDVRLTVEAAATKDEVLVVPVTAVSTASDGRTVVTVVAKSGTHRRTEVRTGATGDGYVEVVPVGDRTLSAGDDVLTGIRQAKPVAGSGE
ncbi:peptidoglycan-binding domain-containing protein [Streptomyces himalayensis]|uniref:peptidoglycan-binding domain-containing protein n=1 Tax=Streptomyces himalayensis TaxID=2820085 RepID=UPI0028ACD6AE|nr:peptidoglycan-binding domain-containing protein [Streptomyces himalayensis]